MSSDTRCWSIVISSYTSGVNFVSNFRTQRVNFAALELAIPIRFQNASHDSCRMQHHSILMNIQLVLVLFELLLTCVQLLKYLQTKQNKNLLRVAVWY